MKLSTFATALCGLCFSAALPATGPRQPADFAQTVSYTKADAAAAVSAMDSLPVPADGKLPSFSLHEGESRIFHLDRPIGPGEARLAGHGGVGTISWSIVGENGELYLFSGQPRTADSIRLIWGWQFNSRPERLYFVFEGGPGGAQNVELSIESRFGLVPQ